MLVLRLADGVSFVGIYDELVGNTQGLESMPPLEGLRGRNFAVAIAYVSAWTDLRPGDVIATGTPGGVGDGREPKLWMRPGDLVEVEIERIGLLRNSVLSE